MASYFKHRRLLGASLVGSVALWIVTAVGASSAPALLPSAAPSTEAVLLPSSTPKSATSPTATGTTTVAAPISYFRSERPDGYSHGDQFANTHSKSIYPNRNSHSRSVPVEFSHSGHRPHRDSRSRKDTHSYCFPIEFRHFCHSPNRDRGSYRGTNSCSFPICASVLSVPMVTSGRLRWRWA